MNSTGGLLELACAKILDLAAPACIKDCELRHVAVNKAYSDALGLPPERILGRTTGALSRRPDAADHEDRERRTLVFGEDAVFRLTGRGGDQEALSMRSERFLDDSGRPFVFSRAEAPAWLAQTAPPLPAGRSAVDFQGILRSLPVGLLAFNADLVVEYVNRTYYELWGPDYPADIIGWHYRELIGWNHEHGIYGPDAPSPDDIYAQRIDLLSAEEETAIWQWRFSDGRVLAINSRRLPSGGFLFTYSDISTLEQRQEESELYRAALEHLPVPVFLRDEGRRLVFANAAYETMVGQKREAIIGTTELDLFPHRADQFGRENAAVLERGETLEKTQDFSLNGREVAAITRIGRIETSKNRRYLVGSVTDVTALRDRQQALMETQARAEKLYSDLFSVMGAMPVGVVILDRELIVEFANRECAEIWKWPEGTPLQGLPFRHYCELNVEHGWNWPGQDFEEGYRQRIAQFRDLKGSISRETQFPDGKHVLGTVTPLDGGRILLTYSDLTDLRQKEREIGETQAQLERIGAMMRDAVRMMSQGLVVIENGVVVKRNDAADRILDLPSDLLEPGQSWDTAFAHCARRGDFGDAPQRVLAGWRRNFVAGKGFSFRFQAASRTWVHMEATASNRDQWMIVFTDVSEMKAREAELTSLLARAEAADQAKSEFLANMSHEIRTPMNGVLGMAELLAGSALDMRQKTFVDVILKSGKALLTIINDILDFSRIDAGELTLRKAPFDPVEAIEDIATLLSAAASEKDIELILRCDGAAGHMLLGDAGRFRQILTNLLGNAIRFTDKGHVLVDLSAEPMADGQMMVTLRISDTGPGFSEETRRTMFDKFARVDSAMTRRHEGTGLGLAITAGLVHLFNGHIDVDSVIGEGSVFTVYLPMPIARERAASSILPITVRDARVLVVDDNPVNCAILTEQLVRWGFDGASAGSWSTALAVLGEAARVGTPVEVMIVDCDMPDSSSIEFVRQVRADPLFSDLAILCLTSFDMAGEEHLFDALAIQAHLMKPVRAALLRNAIIDVARSMRLRARAGDAPEPSAFDAGAPPFDPTDTQELTAHLLEAGGLFGPDFLQPIEFAPSAVDVLLVEDSRVNQIVVGQTLGGAGLQYEIVENGLMAVEACSRLSPGVILMDVSMPMLDGHQATRAIREREASSGSRRVPIIGVTANAFEIDRDLCLAAGMDDYLPKPISPERLLETVRRWLSTDGAGDASLSGR